MLENSIKIGFLGGVGQFGMNLTFYETPNCGFIIDSGSLFATEDWPGVEYLYPDFSYLVENKEKFSLLIITHAHEDHIGSIVHLIKVLQLKILSTEFTISLIKEKINEEEDYIEPEFIVIKSTDSFEYNSFIFEFIPVTHSIIDSLGIIIHSDAGVIFHISDFRIDNENKEILKGKILDIKNIYGEISLLLLDSSNSESKKGASEKDVYLRLKDIVPNSPQKIFITMFASNVERFRNILKIAEENNRKVILLGRSLYRYFSVAQKIGYISENTPIVPVENYFAHRDEKYIFITTGSQGEPFSALSNLAFSNFQKIELEMGDLVIFSSRPIPGNEKSVYKIINQIAKKGGELLYWRHFSDLHASGHASADELSEFISIISPKCFIPIHGEYRHLIENRALAIKSGVNLDNCVIPEVGSQFILNSNRLESGDIIPTNIKIMDKTGIDDVDPLIIKERDSMEFGCIVISVILLENDGRVLKDPLIISRGFVFEEHFEELILALSQLVRREVESIKFPESLDYAYTSMVIKKGVKRFLKKRFLAIPFIFPIVQYL
ncbi:ribonuclease J [bacterium]|nr:ribonuclease J [bacterium]